MDCSDVWEKIKGLRKEEFAKKFSDHLPHDRLDVLFKFVRGNISHSDGRDIKAYVVKVSNPDFYKAISDKCFPNLVGYSYEYDPPKNGQNIIKHGIGFNDVVSYSSNFATLIVPIQEDVEARLVILSDLVLKDYSLEMAPSSIKEMNYTISIVTQREKYRFISARLLSSRRKKYKETISHAIGKIIVDEQERQDFINRCVEKLERDLIERSPQRGNL